jgi:hypothetical protein
VRAAAGLWGFALVGAGLWVADAREPLLALLLVVAASSALVVVGVRDLRREEPIMGMCMCKCGRPAVREFLPGHDLRAAARLLSGVSATQAAKLLVREHGSVANAVRAAEGKGSTS